MSKQSIALRDIIKALTNIADEGDKGLIIHLSGGVSISEACEPEQDYSITSRVEYKEGRFTTIEISSNLKVTIGKESK